MANRVVIRDRLPLLRLYRREILRLLRVEGGRVRTSARAEVKRKTGALRRGIRVKTGWDSSGPYARVITSARRVTRRKNEDGSNGEITSMFRYGLAKQKREQYLERGLARTPRR